ncbi:hypothetical protein O181_022398 [Austropuccinia psidii MF-1]|uniref:Uncharacterized protein n=1 Tax=Austropuccinia psidii MF-1 TaxID=1389203 RepID=A0A9Q3CGS4_9BASI|nr:hypothetical protein [Austropuccinia psidii MF-1]
MTSTSAPPLSFVTIPDFPESNLVQSTFTCFIYEDFKHPSISSPPCINDINWLKYLEIASIFGDLIAPLVHCPHISFPNLNSLPPYNHQPASSPVLQL